MAFAAMISSRVTRVSRGNEPASAPARGASGKSLAMGQASRRREVRTRALRPGRRGRTGTGREARVVVPASRSRTKMSDKPLVSPRDRDPHGADAVRARGASRGGAAGQRNEGGGGGEHGNHKASHDCPLPAAK